MNRHTARLNYDMKCPICHAEPRRNCVMSRNAQAMAEIMGGDADQAEYARDQVAFFEFTILSCVHQLQELRPDHYLVAAMTTMLSQVKEGDT